MNRLQVERVHRIRKVDLTFGPLTVLVGPTGSGKTTLLRCIETACGGVSGLSFGPGSRILADGQTIRESTPEDPRASNAVRPDFDLRALGAPSALATGSPLCGDRGQQLAGAMGTLRLAHAEAYERVLLDFRRVVPSFRTLRIPPTRDGKVELRADFADAPDVPQSAWSTGQLLALAILATLHGDRPRPRPAQRGAVTWDPQGPPAPGAPPAPPAVRSMLLFDEPEFGLHPRAQVELVRCFAEAAKATDVCIVVATHSPYVVEGAGIDAVWAMGPLPGGGVVASPLRDHPKLQVAQGISAGQFWSWISEDWMSEFRRA
jgi:energy-coupling factor transporter ATP-binding protein EcfA2